MNKAIALTDDFLLCSQADSAQGAFAHRHKEAGSVFHEKIDIRQILEQLQQLFQGLDASKQRVLEFM